MWFFVGRVVDQSCVRRVASGGSRACRSALTAFVVLVAVVLLGPVVRADGVTGNAIEEHTIWHGDDTPFQARIDTRGSNGQSSAAAAAAPSKLTRSDAPPVGDPEPPEPPEVVRRDAEGRTTVRATRISTPIHVDGLLDEEVYGTVRSIGGFIQQEPRFGDPASEPTEAWIFFDEKNFYAAARCRDSHPERMVVTEMRRDSNNIIQNENFSVNLDTFHDRRNGILFQVTPAGAFRDALITDEGNPNNDWNTIWDVKAVRDDQGWTVEMVIPFKSLRYAAGGPQVWGVSIRRNIRWKNELVYITPVPPSFGGPGIYKSSFGATLVGIEAPAISRNFEVKPYAISGLLTDRTAKPAVSNRWDRDAGVDVKYGLTRSLIADLSYNTDFAQVEVDDQQVNLTRFSLLYPEKREFFLEGQGIFDFASLGGRGGGEGVGGGIGPSGLTPILFFSRQIGLSGGNPIPIVAGGRVTGRAGPFTLGLLNVETDRSDQFGVKATNFSVVRVRRDILRRSAIGFVGTNRSVDVGGTGSNQVFGFDANFAFFKFVQAKAYYAQTRTPGRMRNAASYLGEYVYNADRYGFVYQHLVVGENFNPEIGFVRRTGFKRNFAGVRFSPRPKSSKVVRKFYYEANLDNVTDGDYRLETREGQASFAVEFQNSDRWTVEYTNSFDYLAEPFKIASGVTLPVGSYEFQRGRVSYMLGSPHRVSGNISASHGSFYDGTITETGYNGRVIVTPRFFLEPRISFNWVDLREGKFKTTLLGARTTLAFTPRTFFSGLLQYNSSNNSFSTNLRFRWEYRPGSEMFLVYSEGRDTGLRGFPTLQGRGLVVKLTRLFRL